MLGRLAADTFSGRASADVVDHREVASGGRSSLCAEESPLWVIGRHRVTSASCPLFPSKRIFVSALSMSALCHWQTFAGHMFNTTCPQKRPLRLDLRGALPL